MKVLVCATEYYPHGSGIANVVYYVVEELKKRGVECTVCSPTGPDVKLGSLEKIKKYRGFGLLDYWESVRKHYEKNEKEFDVFWLHIPLFIRRPPFPDSICTFHSTYRGYHKLNLSSLPSVYYLVFSLIERYCLTKISNGWLTAVGPDIKEELIEQGVDHDKIQFIPNGVDTEIFKPRRDNSTMKKKYGIENDAINVFSIGRLSIQKQPLKLLDAFSRIEETEKYQLIIAGKGPLEEELRKRVASKNIKNVSFLGYIPESEKPHLYSCMDAFITSSIYEGIPLTLLESLSSGLPCITSNIPNLRAVIEESNAGIAVDYDDPDAYRMIEAFLESDLETPSKMARKYAVEKHSWSQISEKYLQTFKAAHEKRILE